MAIYTQNCINIEDHHAAITCREADEILRGTCREADEILQDPAGEDGDGTGGWQDDKGGLPSGDLLDTLHELDYLQRGNHMDDMIAVYLSRISGTPLEVEFLQGMKRLEKMLDGESFHHAAGCAGTEIQSKIRESFQRVLKTIYDLDIKFRHAVSAEINADKRAFIAAQHPGITRMAANNADLADAKFFNLCKDRVELVPHIDSWSSGIVCTSRTPASNTSSSQKDCVQKGEGATGVSWIESRDVVDLHLPKLLTLECVKQLFEKAATFVSCWFR